MIHYHEKNHGYKPQSPAPLHVSSILSPAETCEALVESAVARHHQRIDILFLKVSLARGSRARVRGALMMLTWESRSDRVM